MCLEMHSCNPEDTRAVVTHSCCLLQCRLTAEKRANLTFQPQINKTKGKRSFSSSRNIDTPPGKTRMELLYEKGKSWMTRHSNAQMMAIRQSKELEECTFAPSLNMDAKGRQRPRAANRLVLLALMRHVVDTSRHRKLLTCIVTSQATVVLSLSGGQDRE